jgi:penicillin G amidase
MKVLKRIGIGVAALLVVVLAAGAVFVWRISHRGVPEYDGAVDLKGLRAEVTVYRDRYAVPHIIAKNEPDLYRAVGYVMAQDRLWQMDLLRRVTQGRLSEIFGKKLLDADVLFRSLRIPENSGKVLAELTPQEREALEAFADGVNQYIESRGGSLPPEFTVLGYRPEKWEITHTMNLIGYMAWDLASGWREKITLRSIREKVGDDLYKEIAPDFSKHTASIPAQARIVLPEFQAAARRIADAGKVLADSGLQVFGASNNWTVSGKLSASGRPILANDMHLGYSMPSLWMQMHQVAEGTLDVTGVALPGTPFIIAGHNKRIAWGMTNFYVDNVDFYIEKADPANAGQYLYRGKSLPFEVRKEKILIKGGEVVEKTIRFTVHGPMVADIKETGGLSVSMKWMGSLKSNEVRAVYLLNRAGDWTSFTGALRHFCAVAQMFNYADVDGNIGIYGAGGVPVRSGGGEGGIVPGWDGQHEWKGLVAFEELPHEYNPPRGFVSSANNLPAAKYRHYINGYGFATPDRLERINEMIMAGGKITMEYVRKMQGDFSSPLAKRNRDVMVRELGNDAALTAREKGIIAEMGRWDGAVTAESSSGALGEVFYLLFLKNTFEDEIGEALYKDYIASRSNPLNAMRRIWDSDSKWFDRVDTKDRVETFHDIVLKSFRDAVALLDDKCGSRNWKWGTIHALKLEHPMGKVKALDLALGLNSPSYPVGGSYHTIPQFAYKFAEPFGPTHGPSQRHIYDLSNWDNSKSTIPAGICGVPASRHYCDQMENFVAGISHDDVVGIVAVKKAAVHTMTLRGGR